MFDQPTTSNTTSNDGLKKTLLNIFRKQLNIPSNAKFQEKVECHNEFCESMDNILPVLNTMGINVEKDNYANCKDIKKL